MKIPLSLILMILITRLFGQSTIEWEANRPLQLSDFSSPETEINDTLSSYSLSSGDHIDFGYNMSVGEFMFTKNFNSKVSNVFSRNAAMIVAPDTLTANQLMDFAQYSFDLSELYARKMRVQLYEQKGTFSDISFFKPIIEQLQEEMIAERARVLKLTDMGKKEELLKDEHQNILKQISELAAFCKQCKPPKKKKQ